MNLYPFQEEVLKEMLHFLRTNKSQATYNACEQGLGKCAMSVRAAEELKAARVLIVCPAVMRLTWKDEIEKWAKNRLMVYPILTGDDAKELDPKRTGWTIVSYSLVSELHVLNKLTESKYDLFILDEAHSLKNKKARRTRACLIDLWPRTEYRIFLSGTPCTTSIVDLWTTAARCAPDEFKDFDRFARRYTHVRIHPKWGARYLGLKNGEELKSKIREAFFIRRTKAEVLKDLPPKTFQQVTLPQSLAVVPKGKDEAAKLQAEVDSVSAIINEGRIPQIPKSLAEHRRLQGEKKAPSVVEFCRNMLEEDVPIVLFGWHQNVIDCFKHELRDFEPAVITGGTAARRRHEAVRRFQAGETNLFIANLVAGGIGTTLTHASVCVLGELDWSPATVAQAVDRVHRIGAKYPVMAYYFVVANSIDEIISRAIISKAKTISQVVDNG